NRLRRLAVHDVAHDRPTRHHDRRFLRAPARDRRRADGDRKRACDPPRAAGQAGGAAPARQPHLDPWVALQAALQALAYLCLRDPGLGDRFPHRLRRCSDGHRRRISAGADADLRVAGADRDGDRHVHGAHARDHGFRNRDARGHQPPRGRVARHIPDGRGRDRRAVRRARRTEDEQRASSPPPGAAGASGRDPLRARPRGGTGKPLFHPYLGSRFMTWRSPLVLIAALGALTASAAPAAAERLIASLSNHRVMVTSNFTGEELVLFGGIEQDAASRPRRSGYDVVVTVTGPRQTVVTFRRARIPGIWVTAVSRVTENAPAYVAVLSNRPLDAITNTETLRRLQLGLDNIPLAQRASVNIADAASDDPFRLAFIKIKS